MHALLSLLFPARCLACSALEAGVRDFCVACAETVEPVPPGCLLCAEPGDFAAQCCPRCARHPPPFSRAVAAFTHGGAVSRAIHAFKYEDRPDLAGPLARLWLTESAELLRDAPAHVCGIPLHRGRFRERRYDQAQLLAGTLAHETGRRFVPRALTRERATERQVGRSEAEREENVRDAFRAEARRVQGRAFLLVDDVLTTGATARAAARALREAGATDVQILTLARAHTAPSPP